VAGVAETATGWLDVGLPALGVDSLVVVDHGVQAGQAGAGGKKGRQEEDRLGSKKSRLHERSIATGAVRR
jgi:hypothetical protein